MRFRTIFLLTANHNPVTMSVGIRFSDRSIYWYLSHWTAVLTSWFKLLAGACWRKPNWSLMPAWVSFPHNATNVPKFYLQKCVLSIKNIQFRNKTLTSGRMYFKENVTLSASLFRTKARAYVLCGLQGTLFLSGFFFYKTWIHEVFEAHRTVPLRPAFDRECNHL